MGILYCERSYKNMKREYPDVPLIGVGAVVVDAGRVALVRRGQPPLLGEWSIPGGVLEVGETLREGAMREAREETGLIVDAGELLGIFERLVPGDDGRVRYHYVLMDFLCVRTGGALLAASDAADVRWFRPEELDELKLASDTLAVIQKAFETVAEPADPA
jgi:8-oxo-dGTP diphosphatase